MAGVEVMECEAAAEAAGIRSHAPMAGLGKARAAVEARGETDNEEIEIFNPCNRDPDDSIWLWFNEC